jgi:hypothetical protein
MKRITIKAAMAHERRSMSRPIRREGVTRMMVGDHEVLILAYSCVYAPEGIQPYREYRVTVFAHPDISMGQVPVRG